MAFYDKEKSPDKGDKKESKAGDSYKKIRLSAAKDMLSAKTPEALDSALKDYVRACLQENED